MMSKVDPCLFMSKTVICVVYMDDCLFWESLESHINNDMKYLKGNEPSYDLEHSKGELVSELLVVDIKTWYYGGFQFYRTGLIRKVLEYTGMGHCNGFTSLTNFRCLLGHKRMVLRLRDIIPTHVILL